MPTLTGRTPSTSYQELLKINRGGLGVDTNLREVEDGAGNITPLKLATDKVAFHNIIWPASGAVAGKYLKVSSTFNVLEWATITSGEITENVNLFFTTDRARASVSGTTGITYDASTGVISADQTVMATRAYVNSQITGGTSATADRLTTARTINGVSFDGTANISFGTDSVTEGATNKYFTNARASAAAPVQSVFGRTGAVTLTSSDVTGALGFTPQTIATKDVANGYAGLDGNGKLSTNVLPAITINNTFVVASQAAMLALTAEVGDVAIRTDLSRTFILRGASASTLADWQELLTPTDVVTSVAGRTGAITLAQADIAGLTTSSSPTFAAINANIDGGSY